MNSEFSQRADKTPVARTLNQAPENVLLVNAAGVVELANEPALGLFEMSERDLCGTQLSALFDTDGAARLETALRRVLADDPGNRLEEVRVHPTALPGSSLDLSLARMRHRDGVCVVAKAVAEIPARDQARMPRVSDDFAEDTTTARPRFASSQPENAPARQRDTAAVAKSPDLLPWNNPARRAAAIKRRADRTHGDVDRAARQEPEVTSSAASFEEATSKDNGVFFEDKSDSATTKKEVTDSTSRRNLFSWEPAKRDIYAEFETARDQKERQQEMPTVSPAKLLSESIRRFRDLAIAECLLLAEQIDDAGRLVPLDEDLLTAMFEHLIERLVAVSPPYCEASISLSPVGKNGFHAKFADIGRGLSEQEIEAVFKQPELALGISHTGLVEAQQAARQLGIGFSISSSVPDGTTVEISYDA